LLRLLAWAFAVGPAALGRGVLLGLRGAPANEAAGAPVVAKDSECSDGPQVSREVCLLKSSSCMWLELDTKNLCLPCSWGHAELPCPVPGAVLPAGSVRSCEMACAHHQVITQVSACTDVSGDITMDSCYAKGTSASTRCEWTAYLTQSGERRTMCGPCHMDGIGEIPPYSPGSLGPAPGSRVVASASQCANVTEKDGGDCWQPDCPPKEPPIQQRGQPLPLDKLHLATLDGAPQYIAVPVAPPYDQAAYSAAAGVGAAAAGWPEDTAVPADVPMSVSEELPPGAPTLPPGLEIVKAAAPPGLVDEAETSTTAPFVVTTTREARPSQEPNAQEASPKEAPPNAVEAGPPKETLPELSPQEEELPQELDVAQEGLPEELAVDEDEELPEVLDDLPTAEIAKGGEEEELFGDEVFDEDDDPEARKIFHAGKKVARSRGTTLSGAAAAAMARAGLVLLGSTAAAPAWEPATPRRPSAELSQGRLRRVRRHGLGRT